MEKNAKQRWQLACIIVVLLLTLYNILPTLIYYLQPLKQPIDDKRAEKIVNQASERALSISQDAKEWVESLCSTLVVHPSQVQTDKNDPTKITISFTNEKEKERFSRFVEAAGATSISLVSEQPFVLKEEGNEVTLALRILYLPHEKEDQKALFSFFTKKDPSTQQFTKDYVNYVQGRFTDVFYTLSKGFFLEKEALPLADALFDPSKEPANSLIDGYIEAVAPYLSAQVSSTLTNKLEKNELTFGQKVVVASLYTMRENLHKEKNSLSSTQKTIPTYSQIQTALKGSLTKRIDQLKAENSSANKKSENENLDGNLITHAEKVLQVVSSLPSSKLDTDESLKHTTKSALAKVISEEIAAVSKKASSNDDGRLFIRIPLLLRHPLFSSVELDLSSETIDFIPSEEVVQLISSNSSVSKPSDTHRVDELIKSSLYHEVALLSLQTGEKVQESRSECMFEIPLFTIDSPQSFIALSTGSLAKKMSETLLSTIEELWTPESKDFMADVYPRYSIEQFIKATKEDRKMALLAFSPASTSVSGGSFLKPTSLYVLLRGAKKVIDYSPNEELKKGIYQDIAQLNHILQARGFISYSGEELEKNLGVSDFSSDIIFELENFYEPYIQATREKFNVYGRSNLALLECTNVEARILRENEIDDEIQDELLKWRDVWQSAQVSLNPQDHYLVPKPTKSAFWSNIARGMRKYFRGDANKILKWGLDLSGGKSVKVGLYNSSMQPVTDEKDLKQAVTELYARLNKMGVSERTIRVENDTISIDFPGTQDVSSSELVQASAMYFHVVNEKFGPLNQSMAKDVDLFLQEVWNEALLRNEKDIQSLNQIAFQKVQSVMNGNQFSPHVKTLIQEGLRFHNPQDFESLQSTAFDDSVSMIVKYKGDDPSEWGFSRNHPLLIVFRNFALEGANLQTVVPTYDPMKGNILTFNVRSRDAKGERNPQEEFYAWTSQFAEESITGTPRAKFSRGRGWRMAVVLNGEVISAPTLSSPLKDSAMISGNFSQREVQRLAKDLEAGSLTFTPKILSENNVSPELGQSERMKGIAASLLGVGAVIGLMVCYYRFAGFVASVAVLFNLLIIWAVMQNIEAAITLPALAGVVLTVGMAVDANVLVFERIREELKSRAKLRTAIQVGYSRAFSAIVDSNLTTLIAAFILTQFDSGPIRGFAITLIIGVISSMFTSLFMTKYYFNKWADDHPEKETLSMAEWFPEAPTFDFFKWTKPAIIATCALALIGTALTAIHWKSMLGMDFTGGYALVVHVDEKNSEISTKEKAAHALTAHGLKSGEFQIRELGSKSLLRIQLSSSLEEEGRPFHGLPLTQDVGERASKKAQYMANPRIEWIVSALEKGGLSIDDTEKELIHTQWSAISGQFSDAMRNNALYALGLSLIAILIYIAIRFEWKYAISSVLALVHDVVVTLSAVSIFHALGVNLQINLEVVGAIMTIIGYSLNDTIIVFDRVREDTAIFRKKNFKEVVNIALNSTLSRTIMTSSTTLAVLLCLVVFGGSSIFTFSFVMFLGVLLGTFSSLFIAGPLLVYFDKQEEIE